MFEILNLALSSFWSFLGTLLLLAGGSAAVARIILACRGVAGPALIGIHRS